MNEADETDRLTAGPDEAVATLDLDPPLEDGRHTLRVELQAPVEELSNPSAKMSPGVQGASSSRRSDQLLRVPVSTPAFENAREAWLRSCGSGWVRNASGVRP